MSSNAITRHSPRIGPKVATLTGNCGEGCGTTNGTAKLRGGLRFAGYRESVPLEMSRPRKWDVVPMAISQSIQSAPPAKTREEDRLRHGDTVTGW
jgi:hypothetical protein